MGAAGPEHWFAEFEEEEGDESSALVFLVPDDSSDLTWKTVWKSGDVRSIGKVGLFLRKAEEMCVLDFRTFCEWRNCSPLSMGSLGKLAGSLRGEFYLRVCKRWLTCRVSDFCEAIAESISKKVGIEESEAMNNIRASLAFT